MPRFDLSIWVAAIWKSSQGNWSSVRKHTRTHARTHAREWACAQVFNRWTLSHSCDSCKKWVEWNHPFHSIRGRFFAAFQGLLTYTLYLPLSMKSKIDEPLISAIRTFTVRPWRAITYHLRTNFRLCRKPSDKTYIVIVIILNFMRVLGHLKIPI